MLDAMVARGDLNFLFLAPVDFEAMIAPLQKANDAGLPLLTVDTFIGDGDYTNGPVKFPLSFIASDNKEGGRHCLRSPDPSHRRPGKIYIQNVKPGISSTDAPVKPAVKKPSPEYPDVTLSVSTTTTMIATKAQTQVEAMLQKTPDLAGIFGTNVFSGSRRRSGDRQHGLSGTVKVVAFDATETAIEYAQSYHRRHGHRPETRRYGLSALSKWRWLT